MVKKPFTQQGHNAVKSYGIVSLLAIKQHDQDENFKKLFKNLIKN